MKLFHYVHCPFCVRVRIGLSLLNIPYQSYVTPYNDESTPLALTGKKMLPIVVYDNGLSQNESLDILKKLDLNDLLDWKMLNDQQEILIPLIDKIGDLVHSLAMPFWIWTPEFDVNSRKYYQLKKEAKRGPFKDLVKNQKVFINSLDLILYNEVLLELKPFYKSDKLTIMDIMIAAHLWGMYVVPEYQFAPHIHAYLMKIKAETHFDYHEDFWR
jgi:glutaredoxin 2